MAKVVSVNISREKGVSKSPIGNGFFREDWGLEGDAHASVDNRQVSLLAMEMIDRQNESLLPEADKIKPGDFAENLTIEGFDFSSIKTGDKLKIGDVLLEISQVGKKCQSPCAIYKKIGSCIMPTHGVFARVIKGGKIKSEDEIQKEE